MMQKISRLSTIVQGLLERSSVIKSITLAVGELVVFSEEEIYREWQRLIKDTSLTETKLNIRFIHAEQQCMVCFEKYHPLNKEISCPHCGSVGAKILSGEEFYLESMEEG